jgi:pimeloyl-ACP methyl ester carboxylesterase
VGEGPTPALDPFRHVALESYGYALTRFLMTCTRSEPVPAKLVERLREEHGLEAEWQVRGPWGLEDFDRWICADTLEITGLRHRYRRLGAGVPLVVQRDASSGIPDYLTPEALTRAVTVVLQPSPAAGMRGRLLFLDPRTTAEVDVKPGVRAPLAADFTAPFGYLLAQAELHTIENRSLFNADAAGHQGLYLLEDYDPTRRPLVMVHGLWSSPLTWRDLTNDVFGDPTLNRRYQVWHYIYATGAPLLENARLLRETLTKARRDLDPELDDFATRELILIGHSMGGLLSRMSLTASGDAMWDTLFVEPFDEVEPHLEGHVREHVRGLYFWEPLPFVDRAIFIAAPHRGSELADSLIGRIGSAFISTSDELRDHVDKIRTRSGVRVEVPTSVDELSGSHPVMRTLIRLPIREGVVYHSVMGDVSGSEDPEKWTDGIVAYRSSHLEGAASELVIRGADHSVHFDPRASAEVRRILREAPSERVR